MKPKIIKVTESQFNIFLREVTDSYFSKYDVYDFSNKHSFNYKLNEYHLVKFDKKLPLNIDEGIMKTYPLTVTLNYVYNIMQNYDVELYVPNEEQNDKTMANHIIVKTFVQQVKPEFETLLKKAFKTCGYSLGATGYDRSGIMPLKLYQFEPMFQNTINNKLGEHIYHVTTKNKLPNILKNGFTPKNANKLGFMYDSRCYFFLGTDFVLDYLTQANKINKEYINGEIVETNDYVLFEIKTDYIKDKIKFYPDVNFPKGISIFSYANIPPSEITNYYLFSTD